MRMSITLKGPNRTVVEDKELHALRGYFAPPLPLEPKNENCFSPISSDWFIRTIYLIFNVNMVTEDGCQNSLKTEK